MEFRKTSRVALAALVVVSVCFSAPASARSDGHIIRDILLAPLVLPAAIIAASVPRPVVYQETYYVEPPRHVVVRHGYAPPRHDVRHHGMYRNDGRYRRYR
ncbi:MAG: hypothetical protein LBP99_00960 [Azoarcus sp.]|jgi:hypothetical protein|nr:hypothetical protein [Azoarcus sp.]